MKKLDPKSKWLFFWKALVAFVPFSFLTGFYFVSGFGIWQPSYYGSFDSSLAGMFSEIFIWALMSMGIFAVVAYVYGVLSCQFYGYELTAEGFRKEYGIITKKYTTIPYSKIQNVDIYRNLIDRYLGLSEIRIQTAGYSMGPRISEGILPGLTAKEAEKLREELIKKTSASKKESV